MAFPIAKVVQWSVLKIAGTALKEGFAAVLGKLKWGILAERMVTRLIVWGLDKLVKWKSNTMTHAIRDDILGMLALESLPVAGKAINLGTPRRNVQK